MVRSKKRAWARIFFLCLTAVLLSWFGVGVPVHFRALAPSVLIEAARGGETLPSLASWHIEAGRGGPAEILLKAAGLQPEENPALLALYEKKPIYRITGGPAPYFERFLELCRAAPRENEDRKVIEFLIRRENREHLLGFLKKSGNTVVEHLLATRDLTGMTRFMPVFTPAGSPLDATILTAALLVQGNYFSPECTREIKHLTEGALAGDAKMLDELETLFFSFLSLSKRLNWAQMTALIARCPSVPSLNRICVLAHRRPERLHQIYAAALLAEDIPRLTRYISESGDEDVWEDMEFALSLGRGALEELLAREQPVYHPPAIVRGLDRFLGWVEGTPLLRFSLDHPQAALALKMAALLLAGYFLALAFLTFAEIFETVFPRARRTSVVHIANLAGAVFFAMTLWMLLEPALLKFEDKAEAQLRLEFDFATKYSSTVSPQTGSVMLDQVTILVLLLFFSVQLFVYITCLVKIHQIRKQNLEAELKLKLLENEDNLFDLGLYVGLGGTVASLVLLSMDIVEASLIAAYASTLFGIIFVAILKVINLRPYRRQLILESNDWEIIEEEAEGSTA